RPPVSFGLRFGSLRRTPLGDSRGLRGAIETRLDLQPRARRLQTPRCWRTIYQVRRQGSRRRPSCHALAALGEKLELRRHHPADNVAAGEVDHSAAMEIDLFIVAIVLAGVVAAYVVVTEAQHVADGAQTLVGHCIRRGKEIGEGLVVYRADMRMEIRD